jgi:hypothetical protein
MPNYQNSKIYAIRSILKPDLVYVGATVRSLSERFGAHTRVNNKCTSKQVVEVGDAYIELIELFPCNTKEELCKRENELIRSMDCVNKFTYVVGRTMSEYKRDNKVKIDLYNKQHYQDHKQDLSIKKKQYYIENKQAVLAQQKQYQQDTKDFRICGCGGSYNHADTNKRNRHYKSMRHIKFAADLPTIE